MFSDEVIEEVRKVADQYDIELAALMAVVEVESAGNPFEQDGQTPRFLFERHVFFKELTKRRPEKLQEAMSRGLAHKGWQRATQYKDQGNSASRLRLMEKARSVDEECANRSASWGVGQTMGFLAEELGFDDANDMVARMTEGGVAAQVDCMVREIKRKKLDRHLAAKNWPKFAEGYNGAGYRANAYDTKMAAAYGRWKKKLGGVPAAPVHRGGLIPSGNVPAVMPYSLETEVVQRQLRGMGYHQVGSIDGKLGSSTRGAITAFKTDRHIESDSTEIDDELKTALSAAEEEGWIRPIASERKFATEAQAERKAPELTPVKHNRIAAFWGTITAASAAAVNWLGDNFRDALGYVGEIKDRLGAIPGWLWLIGAAGACYLIYSNSKKGTERITEAVQTGERN